MEEITPTGLAKIVETLGNEILEKTRCSPILLVGIKTGGEMLAKLISQYLTSKEIRATVTLIEVNKKSKTIRGLQKVLDAKEKIVFVDDAIWTGETKRIIEWALKNTDLKYYYATVIDPTKLADFAFIK